MSIIWTAVAMLEAGDALKSDLLKGPYMVRYVSGTCVETFEESGTPETVLLKFRVLYDLNMIIPVQVICLRTQEIIFDDFTVREYALLALQGYLTNEAKS